MVKEIVETVLGNQGRLISGSKGRYRFHNPNNIVFFNANICDDERKLWYGDIDLTLEKDKVDKIAKKLGRQIYIVTEINGRFENEEKPLINEFVYKTDGKAFDFGKQIKDHILEQKGKYIIKREEEKDIELPKQDYDKSNFKAFKLPEMSKFKSKDPEEIPYIILAKWLQKKLKTDEQIDLAKYWVRKFEYDAFEEITRSCFKRLLRGDEYGIKKNTDFTVFNYSPCQFSGDPSWSKKGYIYLKITK